LTGVCAAVASPLAHRELIADVVDNASNRVSVIPLPPPAELACLGQHLILSTPRRIRFESEVELVRALRPDIDGVIVRDGGKQDCFR
jgi:hypothetical protein